MDIYIPAQIADYITNFFFAAFIAVLLFAILAVITMNDDWKCNAFFTIFPSVIVFCLFFAYFNGWLKIHII